MSYKTPGVYIKEVSIFPPSVAEVETAIPAFVGYTEKAERNGENLRNVPTKISSLLEYRELFGGPHEIDTVNVEVNQDTNYSVEAISIPIRFHLFDSLRLFFDNGGGDCYIVSVGLYEHISTESLIALGDESDPDPDNSPGFRVGVKAVELYDEPTMIVFPDAVELTDENELYSLQQMALAQCNKLQDRVTVMDLKENIEDGWQASVDSFRNGIGSNNLKYGAAYTPFLYTSFSKEVRFSLIRNSISDISVNPAGDLLEDSDLLNLTADPDLNALVQNVLDAADDEAAYHSSIENLTGTLGSVDARYKEIRNTLLNGNLGGVEANLTALLDYMVQMIGEAVIWKTGEGTYLSSGNEAFVGKSLRLDLDAYAKDNLNKAVKKLIELELNIASNIPGLITPSREIDNIYGDGTSGGLDLDSTGWLDEEVMYIDIDSSAEDYTDGASDDLETAENIVKDLNNIFKELMGFYDSIASAVEASLDFTESILYQSHPIIGNIVKQVQKEMSKIPPSGAMVGLYSFVDDNRGVWKAPANVSVSSVIDPSVIIDDDLQEGLNVDPTAGKSINAIRAFTGKGTLVWGARTLAGNDNEWRYISVRRFFNVVEESVKKATAFAVFEPNDANTWSKVRALITNYLFLKWKDGALQGATPDQAFFVKVGLGLTMTADDILNGIMRVEIGMAVVRPAEFIIISFTHKLVGTP